jgi:hypothetical protein
MGHDEAASLLGEVATTLLDRMRPPEVGAMGMHELARSLLDVTPKIATTQRANICAGAARAILEAIEGGYWYAYPAYGLPSWCEILALLAQQMEPRDAARFCAVAINAQIARRSQFVPGENLKHEWDYVNNALVQILALYDGRAAANATRLLAQIICSDGEPWIERGEQIYEASLFNGLLSEAPVKAGVEGSEANPRACRLTTPELVELLKMPTSFGGERRVILDHLEHRYGRRFNTIWAFVRYSHAEKLDLDFATPPRRPDPATMQIPMP